jgi:hypothetical protein
MLLREKRHNKRDAKRVSEKDYKKGCIKDIGGEYECNTKNIFNIEYKSRGLRERVGKGVFAY